MTDRERIQALGDTLFAVGQALPAVVEAIDRLEQGVLEANGNASGARAEASRAADSSVRCEAKLDAFLRLAPPLPPMRAESPSGLDLRQAARTAASGEFERMARTSDGPRDVVQATPAKLTAVTEGVVEMVFARREAAAKAKADADRLAEIDRRKKEAEDAEKARIEQARKDRRKVIMAVLLAAAGVIGTSIATRIVSKAEGLAQGRQQGVTEGHDMALKEVRAASASASPAPAMPASVAPSR
jgi:hypothetical protein